MIPTLSTPAMDRLIQQRRAQEEHELDRQEEQKHEQATAVVQKQAASEAEQALINEILALVAKRYFSREFMLSVMEKNKDTADKNFLGLKREVDKRIEHEKAVDARLSEITKSITATEVFSLRISQVHKEIQSISGALGELEKLKQLASSQARQIAALERKFGELKKSVSGS